MLKISYRISILIVLFLIVSNCKPIPQDIETIFTVDIYANEISTTANAYLFEGNAILDPNLNTETSNWHITKLIIGEIRLEIKEANLLDWLIGSQLQIIITDNVTNTSISQLIVGYHSLYPSNSIVLPASDADNAFLSNLISKKHQATIEITGVSNQSGVELVFGYSINAVASVVK